MAHPRLSLHLVLSGAIVGCASAPSADRDYEKGSEDIRRAIENTPQSERLAFEAKIAELDVFVRYLRCTGATQVPAPDRTKAMFFYKWPLMESFTVEYPLVMHVRMESHDTPATEVQLAATQQAAGAPWEITDIWTELSGGVKKDLSVPSAEVQRRINRDLPRLLQEREQAANRWLWPACALAGR